MPEEDVMDTWATSSLSPQIVGRWRSDPALYERVFPMTLRAQAHEIIRTWAFYTIVKSHHHFGVLPWQEIALSGWGLAPKGAAKMSKSRDAGPTTPLRMMDRYSADAVRYWAASQGLGKDTIISEEKIAAGARLVTKLWNVAGFGGRFLEGYQPPAMAPALSPSDRWILARSRRLVRQATESFSAYDYAAAKNETEAFLWNDLADNYLEMAKTRLYDEAAATHEGARYALYHALLAVVKLFAPVLPYVTEEIYRGLFAAHEGNVSVHRAAWPVAEENSDDEMAEAVGDALVQVATAARRYKSEHALSLSAPLERLQVAVADAALAVPLRDAAADISSVTRARRVEVVVALDPALEAAPAEGAVAVALAV
jgi:valyl-tRNA synthetase